MKLNLRLYMPLALLVIAIGCKKNQNAVQNNNGNTTQTTGGNTTDTTTSKSSPTISDYATFTLQCVAGSKYIEVSGTLNQGAKLQDAATLDQNDESITNGKLDRWQEWQFSKQTNGYYTIMNLNSGKYLDVPNSSTASGTTLDQLRGNG